MTKPVSLLEPQRPQSVVAVPSPDEQARRQFDEAMKKKSAPEPQRESREPRIPPRPVAARRPQTRQGDEPAMEPAPPLQGEAQEETIRKQGKADDEASQAAQSMMPAASLLPGALSLTAQPGTATGLAATQAADPEPFDRIDGREPLLCPEPAHLQAEGSASLPPDSQPAQESEASSLPALSPALTTADARRESEPADMPALHEVAEEPAAPLQPPLPPLTPGDRLLAILPHAPTRYREALASVMERLEAVLEIHLKDPTRPPQLQVQLPTLGAVTIRVNEEAGRLQVTLLAGKEALTQLGAGQADLLERLQRLDPARPVSLGFEQHQESGQGSRQRRHVYEEWQEEA